MSSGAGRHNVRSGDENIEPKRDISNVCKENEPDFNDGSSFELNISVDHMPAEPPRVVKELDYKLPVDDDSAVNKNSRTSSMKANDQGQRKSTAGYDILDDGYVYEEKFGELLEERF